MTPSPAICVSAFPVRFSAHEAAHLRAKAALKGLTVEQYMRACLGYAYPAQSERRPHGAPRGIG